MLESRSGVYRGTTRPDAERAYHAEARQLAAQGYVPTSEEWTSALGQKVLTVLYAHLPEQAPEVLIALSSLDATPSPWKPPTPSSPPSPHLPLRPALASGLTTRMDPAGAGVGSASGDGNELEGPGRGPLFVVAGVDSARRGGRGGDHPGREGIRQPGRRPRPAPARATASQPGYGPGVHRSCLRRRRSCPPVASRVQPSVMR